MTHTPGPWRRGKTTNTGQITIFAGVLPVCQMYGDPADPKRQADNARLVIAAPDLLAALEEIERDVRSAADHAEEMAARELFQMVQETARAAIAKSRGPRGPGGPEDKERRAKVVLHTH